MQTFLPYPSFTQSAKVLDYRRLGKQRVEVLQILYALLGQSTAYRNHPVTKAWEGYEYSLCEYGIAICDEWCSRGYVDNTGVKISDIRTMLVQQSHASVGYTPHWLGREFVHSSYRRLLVTKKPDYYGAVLGWQEQPLESDNTGGLLDYNRMFGVGY